MADTARNIVTDALLDLGAISADETPSSFEATGALRKLNNLIDAWNLENLIIYGSTQNVFPLVGGQGAYTLGTGGNFSIPRPNQIEGMYIRDNSANPSYDYPMQRLTQQEYADLSFKNQQTTLPFAYFVNETFPLLTVNLYPVPSSSQYQLIIWTGGIISNLSLDDVILMPPGYKRALTANLVIELAASYSQAVPDSIARIAQDSKAGLIIANVQVNEVSIDPRLTNGGWYDITTNRYWG